MAAAKKTLEPLGDLVVVQLVKKESKLALPDEAAASMKDTKVVVVSFGPDVKDINVGDDVVLYPMSEHMRLDDSFGKDLWVIRREAIVGRVK